MANEKNDSRQWFLRIAGGTVFGPVSTKGLTVWAEQGRVVPGNEVSTDRETWVSADRVSELAMTWFVEDGSGKTVGPFNRVAADTFLKSGKAPAGAHLVENKSGTPDPHSDDATGDPQAAPVTASPPPPAAPAPAPAPPTRRIQAEPDPRERRIRDLEQALEKQRELLALARQAAKTQAALEEERDDLRKQMQDIQSQMESLRNNADKDARSRERKLEALKQEIVRLQQEQAEASARPVVAPAPADDAPPALREDVQSMIEDVRRQAQDERQSLERETDALRSRIAELEPALAQRTASEQQALEACAALRSEQNVRIAELASQLGQRETECRKLIGERDVLQRQLGSAMNAASDATNESSSACAELRLRLEQVEVVNAGLQSELAAADKALADEHAQHAELLDVANARDVANRQRVEELETRLQALDAQVREAAPPGERETRLAAELAQARARVVELQGRIARLPEAGSPERGARPVEGSDWLRQMATEELTVLDKALHAERESFNAFRQLSQSRQESIQTRIQAMQHMLAGDLGDGRPRSVHDRIASSDHSRLQSEMEALRHDQERETRQFEGREAELLRRVRVLETEEARLRSQVDASDMQGGRIHELMETIRRREQDLALERRNREVEREQAQSTRQALLKRIEAFESQGVTPAPGKSDLSPGGAATSSPEHPSAGRSGPRSGLSSWMRRGR